MTEPSIHRQAHLWDQLRRHVPAIDYFRSLDQTELDWLDARLVGTAPGNELVWKYIGPGIDGRSRFAASEGGNPERTFSTDIAATWFAWAAVDDPASTSLRAVDIAAPWAGSPDASARVQLRQNVPAELERLGFPTLARVCKAITVKSGVIRFAPIEDFGRIVTR